MAIYTDINQATPEERENLTDVQAVFQALENIFLTRKTERFYNPEFGIDLEDFLFDLNDDLTQLDLFRRVTEAVQKFETRVIIDFASTTVTPDPDNLRFNIDLIFQIRGFEGQQFIYQDSITNDQLTGAVA